MDYLMPAIGFLFGWTCCHLYWMGVLAPSMIDTCERGWLKEKEGWLKEMEEKMEAENGST